MRLRDEHMPEDGKKGTRRIVLLGMFLSFALLIVAACIVETGSILYYLPPLLVSGTVTGFLIGIAAEQVQARVFKNHINGEGKK